MKRRFEQYNTHFLDLQEPARAAKSYAPAEEISDRAALRCREKTHGGDRKSNLPESSGQNDHLIAAQKTRERIASETGTSESYIVRWFLRVRILIAMEFKLIVLKNIFSFFSVFSVRFSSFLSLISRGKNLNLWGAIVWYTSSFVG